MTTLAADIDTLTDGYLAALKSNSDEIARLAEALRKAEDSLAELIEHHQQHHQGNESIRADAAERERDAIFGLTEDVSRLLSERNAARADAERLADAIELLSTSNGYGLDVPEWYGDDNNRDWITNVGTIRACAAALAAHVSAVAGTDNAGRAASGKAVTE